MELGPNQKKWIEALRSGEYRQCTLQLQRMGGYCCLGVACVTHSDKFLPVTDYDGQLKGATLKHQNMPDDILCLHRPNGRFIYGNNDPVGQQFEKLFAPGGKYCNPDYKFAPSSLMMLNDAWRLTFAEIADLIEAFPTLLFSDSK